MLDLKLKNDTLEIRLSGELDHHAAAAMRARIDDAILRMRYTSAVWDLKGLTFMDSTGVGLLMGRYRLLKQCGKGVYLKNPSPAIDKVLKVSGIYTIIPRIQAHGAQE